MGGLRMGEILIILVIVLILFGANRLPQLGNSLGSAIRNFKRGFGGEGDEAPPADAAAKPSGMMASGAATPDAAGDRSKVASKG